MSGVGNPLSEYRRYVIEAWAAHIAVSVGLFEALAEPRTLAELVAEHDWSASALRPLLRALAACGHIAENGPERVVGSGRSRAFFLAASPGYIGHALSFMRTTPAYLSYADILQGSPAV